MDATPSSQPLHWLWHPSVHHAVVLPQNPSWLQQKQLGHSFPPACHPHCASSADTIVATTSINSMAGTIVVVMAN